jgi:glycosyltransferase involved in cell wall biosynthesis
LAAQAARPLGRYSLHVDWHEVWTRGYWREYLGPRRGTLGWLVQRACLRLPQDRAYCFSQLQARRLRAEGVSSDPVVLRGQYAGPLERPAPRPAEDTVLFVGRLVADKQAHRLVEAVALARRRAPCLRAEIVGAGPEAGTVARAIAEHGLESVVTATGFESDKRVRERLARALCLVLPSRREGFGLVVVEAAAAGTPSVVAAGPDNAAVELIENGENGWVAASDAPADLAEAILCVREAGPALRERTADWFARHAAALAMSHSVEIVTAAHRAGRGRGSRAGG